MANVGNGFKVAGGAGRKNNFQLASRLLLQVAVDGVRRPTWSKTNERNQFNDMSAALSPNEESQLAQTIEMFEVITQSQPQDYQSLEILKEAYVKLGRDQDATNTSRRIGQAYVQLGQLSSAILEYESILQTHPDDPAVLAALGELEDRANSISAAQSLPGGAETPKPIPNKSSEAKPSPATARNGIAATPDLDDGRAQMYKIFVESKVITPGDFDLCWATPNVSVAPGRVIDPFIQVLHDKGTMPLDKSLKLLCEKSRLCYLPLEKYDMDYELARSFPADSCQRWCVVPFDRMSKSVLVATVSPFNRQAVKEIESATKCRLLWYIAPPTDIVKALRKSFR